ncbi:hypothetical protein D3C75_654270 [compost metagenome]
MADHIIAQISHGSAAYFGRSRYNRRAERTHPFPDQRKGIAAPVLLLLSGAGPVCNNSLRSFAFYHGNRCAAGYGVTPPFAAFQHKCRFAGAAPQPVPLGGQPVQRMDFYIRQHGIRRCPARPILQRGCSQQVVLLHVSQAFSHFNKWPMVTQFLKSAAPHDLKGRMIVL